MRTIKTGIGVFLCLLLSPVVVKNPLYASIACIMSIQTSVKGSVVAGLTRIKGTILGGIIGYLATYYLSPNHALVCSLGVVLTIYLCLLLDMKEEVTIATVTFLSINLGNIDSNLVLHSSLRVLDNSVGVIIGILINYILARPNHTKDVVNTLRSISTDIDTFIKFKILKSKIKFDIEQLELLIETLEKIHEDFVFDIEYDELDDTILSEQREETIDQLIMLSKELYFHVQSILFLEKKLFLSSYNYKNIKQLYPDFEIDWDIDDIKSPVFNYHLSKIISRHSMLKGLINDIDPK